MMSMMSSPVTTFTTSIVPMETTPTTTTTLHQQQQQQQHHHENKAKENLCLDNTVMGRKGTSSGNSIAKTFKWFNKLTRIDFTSMKDKEYYDHSSVLRNNEMWVIGGKDIDTSKMNYLNLDTLEWSEITTEFEPNTTKTLPTNIRGHSTIIDPSNKYMILFGGENKHRKESNDTFLFNFESMKWRDLKCTGSIPCGRLWHTAVFNPFNNSMLVFGGANGYLGKTLNDLYELNLDTLVWTQIYAKGDVPSARCVHAAMVDEKRRKMIVFGGGNYGAKYNDLFELDLTTYHWTKINYNGTIPVMSRHTVVFDLMGRLIVFAGSSLSSEGQNLVDNHLYEIDLNTDLRWKKLECVGFTPLKREGHTAVLFNKRMVVFGGSGVKSNEILECLSMGDYNQDVSNLFRMC